MLNEEDKKGLFDDLRKAKDEVALLKKKLNEVNKEKEDWFSKKSEFGNQIKSKINSVKDLKVKRNDYTNKVKKLKKERNDLNTKISENIKELKANKPEVPKSRDSRDRGKSPKKLKTEIEGIEFRMETEPMSIEKEQKLMKMLKALKKELVAMGGYNESKGNLKKISKDTDKLKKKANEVHKDLQDIAKKSQELHETLITESKSIDNLKKAEEDAYNKFFESKKKFTELSQELKEKLKGVGNVKNKLEENSIELKEEKAKKDTKKLKEKAKEVEEKIEKKKKLTTEDLLIMQRNEADKK